MLVVPALIAVADEQEFDPNSVTPGIWGFVFTFLLMAAVVLLILDMVRRIRRTNYRAQVREQLEAERLAAEGDGQQPDAAGDAPRDDDGPGASSR